MEKVCNIGAKHNDKRLITPKKLNTSANSQGSIEREIIQKSLECIKVTTGRNAPKQSNYTITRYELDLGVAIGGGGFSTVLKAQFRGMTVAVKELKDTLEQEIEIWSKLRHDHVVPFYGASTLSSPPYIVSRYMKNGNLVQYLSRRPNADRIKLLHEISLGMRFLHEENVVHGDLKGVNVLVDDSGKACITDFGLSKARSMAPAESNVKVIAGTLRFLAPEALRGQPLTFETDVYAFGMVIYEVSKCAQAVVSC
ncbi:kinase-like protein [Gyrodon lividus]|nr:kinase-like protein [Gyrodon lividus]